MSATLIQIRPIGLVCSRCTASIERGYAQGYDADEVDATLAAITRDGGGPVEVAEARESDPSCFRCCVCGEDVVEKPHRAVILAEAPCPDLRALIG